MSILWVIAARNQFRRRVAKRTGACSWESSARVRRHVIVRDNRPDLVIGDRVPRE